MSKERELLERWVSQFGNLRHDFNLLTETKELLAQSEYKREPLTSKLISLGNNCHESFIKGIRFAEKMHGIGKEYD